MDINEHLTEFFQKVKTIGFFERLFFWKRFVSLSYDAYQEYKNTDKTISQLKEAIQGKESELKLKQKDIDSQKELYQKLEKDFEILKAKKDSLDNALKESNKRITGFEKEKEQKDAEYEKKVTQLNSLKKQLDDDRIRIQEEREAEIEARFETMRQTWRNHENSVEEGIKNICSKHQVEYLSKSDVPFKGSPDNTIKICNEYVIFDAKSPRGENLDNFPTYIKTQADSVKKYAKIKGIKKDIFLVIPSNTVHVIDTFCYNMADYTVFVITEDSLEPVILSLKKIEAYEFAEQMSPDDRDNICRLIGRFAHSTKRKIQIDNFFSNEFINILEKCDTLPDEIKEKAVEYEKSTVINPSVERRAKRISHKDLKKETKKIKQKAEIEDIKTEVDSSVIETIPLYK